MFIEANDEIKIELYIKEGNNGFILVETNLDKVPEGEKVKYKVTEFKLKPITWKQNNDLLRSASVNRGPGVGTEFDWILHREKKLCMILVGWDAKDKDGKSIQLNNDNIFKLCPRVANALLDEFDRLTLVGDEERKN
jgi:hypothetical protein